MVEGKIIPNIIWKDEKVMKNKLKVKEVGFSINTLPFNPDW